MASQRPRQNSGAAASCLQADHAKGIAHGWGWTRCPKRLISGHVQRRVSIEGFVVMQLGPRFADALRLAHDLHAGQTRKASQVPYISHVLAVTATVLEHGGGEDAAIGALLHDAVEDCGGHATAELIRSRFGDHVAALVLDCSDCIETPKPPWLERKNRYLEHLPQAPPEVLLISAADKLHNLQSLLREERLHGRDVWAFFRAGRDGTLWYYGRLLAIFRHSNVPEGLVDQIEQALRELERRVAPRRDSQIDAPNAACGMPGSAATKVG
jgi:hypothetical protein